MAEPAGGALLDDLLTGLEVRVNAFALCRVARGRALALQAMPSPLIHYALQGPGVLRTGGGAAISFAQHSFILLPAGLAHHIEAPDAGQVGCTIDMVEKLERLPALADGLLQVSTGDDEDGAAGGAVLACGAITAAYGAGLGLFDALHEPVAEQLAPGDPLHGAFEAMLSELADPRFGTRAMTAALLKQCLVWLLRRRLDGTAKLGVTSWPLGAVEPGLADAVRMVLDRPADPYTVEGLAGTAGMSRSVFAARFQQVFGRPPMEFVKRVRLRHAAWLLEATDLPVAALASAVGYESRSYLSRAFRAVYGADPTAYRAAQRGSGRSSTS